MAVVGYCAVAGVFWVVSMCFVVVLTVYRVFWVAVVGYCVVAGVFWVVSMCFVVVLTVYRVF